MAFRIIRAEERVASMLTWFSGVQRKITDLVVGGKTRTKFEALAVEMERQDYGFKRVAKKAIPTSIYTAFNFPLLPAVRATGQITFTASPAPTTAINIPAGTQVATAASSTSPEKVYETLSACTIGVGTTTTTATVACTVAGTNGNTGTNTIVVLKQPVSGVVSVANASPLTNGDEQETEDSRRKRFTDYIASLTRGTSRALSFAARTAKLLDADGLVTERVVQAGVTEPPGTGPAGTSTVYIHNGVDGASANLITEAQRIIDGYTQADGTLVPGYKAAGVIITVAAATVITQDVTATVVTRPGYDTSTVKAAIEEAITVYLASLELGQDLIRYELVERIMGVEGVYNITSLTVPAADVVANENQVLEKGTLTITMVAG